MNDKTYTPEEIKNLDFDYMDKRDIQKPPRAFMVLTTFAILLGLVVVLVVIYGVAYLILSAI